MEKVKCSERIKEALSIKNLKASDLCNMTGISKSTMSQYISGLYEPKQDRVWLICKALHVDEAWLMGYDVPMEKPDRFPAPRLATDVVTFPIIGSVAAGYDNIANEDYTGDTIDIPAEYLHGRPKSDYFVLSVNGNSMYPMYLDGDKVLVLRQTTLNHSEQVGVIMYNGDEATLKKVKFEKGKDWLELIPINPEYAPRRIEGEDLEDCRVLGIPKLLIRDLG